jgi:peroxiredoxin Q/BCP
MCTTSRNSDFDFATNTMKIGKSYSKRFALLACLVPVALQAAAPPKVGDKAADFLLQTLDNQAIRLSDLTSKSRVILIVLRGWPGYQCPICTRQVQDYIAEAQSFAAVKARVVMVYPGPADNLKAHAKEFLQNKQWPKDYIYLTDGDYKMVNAYGLRWDAPKETAYPATFVLDPQGNVLSAKISHSHGDRTRASDILEELKRLPSS